MVYPALLPLMRAPRLPLVDRTDAPADLNGLVLFAERRNLFYARVPSHFKRSLLPPAYTLKFGVADTFQMLVNSYRSAQCHDQEHDNLKETQLMRE
jgi:hypothetical protein